MLKTFLAMFWYGEQVLPQPKYTPVVRGVKDSRKLTELKAVVYFFLAWFNHATKSTNSGFCGIKEMQKCNLAKWANNWSISIAKRKSLWTEDSSKKYCRHIYQIKAIVKTFLLNIVSAVFGGDYRLQGTSAEKTPQISFIIINTVQCFILTKKKVCINCFWWNHSIITYLWLV